MNFLNTIMQHHCHLSLIKRQAQLLHGLQGKSDHQVRVDVVLEELAAELQHTSHLADLVHVELERALGHITAENLHAFADLERLQNLLLVELVRSVAELDELSLEDLLELLAHLHNIRQFHDELFLGRLLANEIADSVRHDGLLGIEAAQLVLVVRH